MVTKKIKQSIKKALILATTLVLVVGGTNSITFAETTNNSNLKDNEVTSYWSQHFSKFNSDLESGKLLELKDTSTVYLKYTQTNDNQEIVEKFTEDQYQEEIINEKIAARGIGSFQPNGTSSWLRLDLQVYSTGYGKYEAYSFWEWKTRPKCRFTDVNGIYVSSEFTIGKGPIYTQYIAQDSHSNQEFSRPSYSISQFGNGVASQFKLKGDNELFTYIYNMGMTSAPIEFSNSSSRSGRIYTNYIHRQVGLGGLSFDASGKPSLGVNISKDEFSGSVYISR